MLQESPRHQSTQNEKLGLYLHARNMIKYTIDISKCNMQHTIKYAVCNTETGICYKMSLYLISKLCTTDVNKTILNLIHSRKYSAMLHF